MHLGEQSPSRSRGAPALVPSSAVALPDSGTAPEGKEARRQPAHTGVNAASGNGVQSKAPWRGRRGDEPQDGVMQGGRRSAPLAGEPTGGLARPAAGRE